MTRLIIALAVLAALLGVGYVTAQSPGCTGILTVPFGGVGSMTVDCSAGPTPTPTATLAPIPTETPWPTSTAIPSSTPPPTSTDVPTATATPLPTSTPVPTPTATATLTPAPPTSTTAPPTATPTPTPAPPAIIGLAILGDSIQDEYRANDQRGGSFAGVTFNWVEQLAIVRSVPLGAWGSRAEPRRTGYANNWARSGATSDQMLAAGQHTGAAAQCQAGAVSHAVIQIGLDDFYYGNLVFPIYSGSLSGSALAARLDTIATNVLTAATTIRAGGCQVLIAATQDYISDGVLPPAEIAAAFPDPVGRARVVAAFAGLNQRLHDRALAAGVPYTDFNGAFAAELAPRRGADNFVTVGGARIDLNQRGNSPLFGLLADQYGHVGTVLSGLYANVMIDAINQAFGTALAPMTDAEILQTAGL